jgi:sensor histidine kinase YesM
MKPGFVLLIILFSATLAFCQNKTIFNLQQKLNAAQNDTTRVLALDSLSLYYLYFTTKQDSAFYYINQAIDYSIPLEDKKYLILEYSRLGLYLLLKAQFAASLESTVKGIKLSQKYNLPYYYSPLYYNLCILYLTTSDFESMLKNAKLAAFYLKYVKDPFFDETVKITSLLGCSYCLNQNNDSGFYYLNKALLLSESSKDETAKDAAKFFLSNSYFNLKDYDKTDSILRAGVQHSKRVNDYQWIENFLDLLAVTYLNQTNIEKAIATAHIGIDYADSLQDKGSVASLTYTLYQCYEKKGMADSSLFYLNLSNNINNGITHSGLSKQIQQIEFSEQLNQKEEEARHGLEKEKIRNNVGLFVFITAIIFFLLIVIILWYNNRQKQKANILLQQQKEKIEGTLQELEDMQAQLIQSEKEKMLALHEREVHELEAQALRAQMNPHFIFNCMNSIKSLIQKNEQEKAIVYLTTFSKLMRTIFQNSDKREISLFDEIETCRLYTQLESMRFGNKFNCEFNVDDTLDLKSVMVPALIIQPFIENAIWHGIMPKDESGNVKITVDKTDHTVYCIIDDNGIGREVSVLNKFTTESSSHQSKGVHLTQARLDLDNLLNERNTKVEIIDKKDENGKSTGTTVLINIKED